MPGTAKQRALDAIERLPENVSFEEVMERLYFLSKVERGLEQEAAGQSVSHEEAKRRLGR
jgi:predicted transcriptional regulator